MKDRIIDRANSWLGEAKERDWKKIGRNGLIVLGLVAGNTAAGAYMYELQQKVQVQEEKINFLKDRLIVTERFQAEDAYFLCLSILQNRPSSMEEDEADCKEMVLERESFRPR